ncbi:hypothetical protein B9T21_09320 [Wohlfahrtiimonas chitiniclastica]|uniref:hypothetical protein n=1 Tax=Wohlfahrtiimonas chitiniclastica TaxID=400946 RepID=UPI000B9878CE|nr:hypothetical protein [Wohlfahrtiimonas chitiniclastica]OYQ86886.1 hypothetical protein B9T21_09320 [Wohlfahrtiimonas chitiniclastica]
MQDAGYQNFGKEFNKIIGTKATEKYSGENWLIIEPIYSFFLNHFGGNVTLPSGYFEKITPGMTSEELDKMKKKAEEMRSIIFQNKANDKIVYSAQRYLTA